MNNLQAFHNDQAVKDEYLARVQQHRELDNIVQGTGWENGKGCAVGCTLGNYSHAAYETELGIPEWLAYVKGTIFEGLPLELAKLWPERFLAAIRPGADLDAVKAPFLVFVLESTLDTFDHDKHLASKVMIDRVIDLYRSGETDLDKFKVAEDEVVAEAARSAGAGPARAGTRAARTTIAVVRAAARVGWSAEAIIRAARAAAWVAGETAWVAAWVAGETAGAVVSAAETAESTTCYQQFADKLIELLAQTGD